MHDFTPAPELNDIRQKLPEQPGCYKYYDESGTIIYIGKAINLRKRVNSYFNRGDSLDYKTKALVRRIRNIEYVVTNTEMEALLLENNLIKQHQPRFNIALRDGKSYPYICIKKERFPRVFPTRNRIKDGSEYFGPYPTLGTMYTLLNFIRDNFKIRTCNYNLSPQNIAAGKFRACLEFQIGKCAAPCVGRQPEADYEEDIRQIRQILRGNFKAVIQHIESEIDTAAAALQFERAHYLKMRIEQIKKYKRKNTIVSDKIDDVEVITALTKDNLTIVNHFKLLNGTIVKTHCFDIWLRNGETETEVFEAVISRLMADDHDFAKTVVLNFDYKPAEWLKGRTFTVPAKGDLHKIMALSVKNCETILTEKSNLSRVKQSETKTADLLKRLQTDLRLTELPQHIECFDNSNIQGYAPVSSVVVFKDGKPSKKDYRVYNVKTVEGPDDFATMHEAVTRRYSGLVRDGKPLPNLVVIDGGKGQLSAAVRALTELGLETKIAIISIAKRLEEIYYKDDPYPLYIDKKSPSLKLIQRLRDEAHTTAITFHRKKRETKTLATELTQIKGVGAATAKRLLMQLKSVKAIKTADLETLTQAIGQAKAQLVLEHYHGTPAVGNSTSPLVDFDEMIGDKAH
jgi:excinuclease ABC subunit C